MPNKRIAIYTGGIYHVFNRGVAKQKVFFDFSDYKQAMMSFTYYRFAHNPIKFSDFKKLTFERQEKIVQKMNEEEKTWVHILAFVLMPNHFHFLIKQNEDKGLATFISKFTNSYTKYFNIKRNSVGPIFQGVFKDVRIETDEQLIHVSRYIHLNPLVSSLVSKEDFLSYPYSSLPQYLNHTSSFVETKRVLSYFPSSTAYKEFVLDQEDYGRNLELLKHHLLD